MATRVLLTKNYDAELIREHFGETFAVDCQSFINIESINANHEATAETAIITSRNAINALSNQAHYDKLWVVGENTAAALQEHISTEMLVADNAKELLEIILQNSEPGAIDFWCGTSRLDFLPRSLAAAGYSVHEKHCYHTQLLGLKLEEMYDVYAFFSPTGVEGFFRENTLAPDAKVIAIGNTTAQALKLCTQNPIFTAQKPNLASIAECIKYNAYA
ncbi:MAG: uroporphyrinogen-III synthase [Weeksellaceae bacterium]|nr:uroporphyrinogen-III synthase [Weeksellaceae bacterium]